MLSTLTLPDNTKSGAKGTGRSAENHYSIMNIKDICALLVANISAKTARFFFGQFFPEQH
jgi:hypothetical protein